MTNDTIVELEFDMAGADFFLVQASERAECEIRLDAVYQRSDGSVLQFVSVQGADPAQVLALSREAPGIKDARHVSGDIESALFEFISETPVATALADNESVFTDVTAVAGEGRLVAEVPSHVNVSRVIEAFLEEYPAAELAARRETDHHIPMLTANQQRSRLVADLTDRQLQALRTAHARGYFEWPRDVRADDVAADLDIATPTFAQHLRVAERKLLDTLFEGT